jgi:hypothetical protein
VSRLDGVNRVYRVLFACITLPASCSCPAWEDTAVARRTPPFNPQLAFDNSKGFLSNTVRFATLVSEGPSYQRKYLRSPHTIHNRDLPNSRRGRGADRRGSAPARCPSRISPSCSRDALKSVDINPLIVLEVGGGVVAVVEFC